MTRLPPSSSRPMPVAKHAKRLRPKTYSVAVYLVGAVFVFQIAMLISVFWLRAMVVPVNTELPKPVRTVAAPTKPALPPVPAAKPAPSDLPSLPALSTTMPHPALLSVPEVNDKLAQIGSLNDQALDLVQKAEKRAQAGQQPKPEEYQPAIDDLVKAEDLDPRNPDTLKNLAETYYLMNNSIASKIYWQRLVDLGPGVGSVYAAARDHVLLMAPTHDADPIKATSLLPRQIYIDAVEKTPVATINGQPQFNVHAVLMRQNPNMPNFDQKKLQPYVVFYQMMPDGTLLPDLSQRTGAFDDTFLFWNHKLREPFGVDYILPIPGSPGPNNTTMGEYYGFVIGIYYDKKLQDTRSEPADLITREPLPLDIE